MSTNSRERSKEPTITNSSYETSNSKPTEAPSESHITTNSNTQKASTSSGQRPGPKSIGHYIIGKTIGEGTFGKVKLANHILTGEKVAIKILEKSKIADVSDVERVAREIHILKLIRHPNIIQLYEIIETPKQLFLIMEYADGGELFDYIVAHTRVKEKEASRFFQEIIAGIEYMHKLNIVHRDMKPENLLLDHNKHIKIVDFGLSNTYKDGETLKTACGSPCYAAPEMIAGKKYLGLGADLWSCGVILFAMVCGYLPFEDPNTSQLYKKILSGEYTIPKTVSAECKDLIKNILNTDPVRRFTIEDIRKHPWFNQVKPTREVQGIIVGLHKIPIDYDILKHLAQFNFDLDLSEKCIDANKHNHITTSYYLLLKKHLLNGGKSPADFNSDSFDSSLLTQPNPRRAKALKNNFTAEAKNNKTKAEGGSQKSVKDCQVEHEFSDKEESRRNEVRTEQASRGAISSKNRGYIDPKRVGSTGGSSSRDRELSMNNNSGLQQSTIQQVNLDESFKAGVEGKFSQFTPQTKDQAAENNLKNLLPIVRNPSREYREAQPGNIISTSQTPANDKHNVNMLLNNSLIRDIQAPSRTSTAKTQAYKAQPPAFKNHPAINPRANNFLNGSINKEVFEEKLNYVAINAMDNPLKYKTNNFVEGNVASTSPKNNRKVTHQIYPTNGLLADHDCRITRTIDRESGSTIRSTPKHNLIGGIPDNLDNSKDLSLDDSLNMSHMQVSRKGRVLNNNTLNTSYITNALNTSMHRIKPHSQSPGKQPQLIFIPKEPLVSKPTNVINPGSVYRAKYYVGKPGGAKLLMNDVKMIKPTTAIGTREYRGRSIGGNTEHRKQMIIPSYDNYNNSNNTSILNYSQIETRTRDERSNKRGNGTNGAGNIPLDLPHQTQKTFYQDPNITMYFPESKGKKFKQGEFNGGGMTFYGTNFTGFPINNRAILK